jgi:cell wall assembly regulator SMI1
MTTLTSRLRAAVDSGVKARSRFYRAIDLEDEQRLGAPATEDQVLRLERAIARALPPSYREFLLLHNGWAMIDGGTDLLSIEDLLTGPRASKIAAWQSQARRYGETRLAEGLVIGHSNISQARIILDPKQVDEHGEWALIAVDKDNEDEYASFLAWLEQSVRDYQLLAEEGMPPEQESEG